MEINRHSAGEGKANLLWRIRFQGGKELGNSWREKEKLEWTPSLTYSDNRRGERKEEEEGANSTNCRGKGITDRM